MRRAISSISLVIVTVGVSSGCDQAPVTEAPQGALVGGKADAIAGDAEPTLHFTRDFGEVVPTSELEAGGVVIVRYEPVRMREIIARTDPAGYFRSAHHCYGYGGCEVTFPRIFVHYRWSGDAPWIDGHVSMETDEVALSIPDDAEELQIWFDTDRYRVKTWYQGCAPACAEHNYANTSTSQEVEFVAYDTRVPGGFFAFPVATL